MECVTESLADMIDNMYKW